MSTSRRWFVSLLAGGAGAAILKGRAMAKDAPGNTSMQTRQIPRSGESLPVVGLGTWQTFDVGSDEAQRTPLREVLRLYSKAGARLVDSSPMYGRAEEVVGDLVGDTNPQSFFLATKVWTSGKKAGEEQMATSLRRLRAERIDLMQIHNLLDWKTHLPLLRAGKAAGRYRYIGITHYDRGAFAEMETILRREKVDFVQLPYSAAVRDAEKRLLPAAADTGTAVLVMRPFDEGALFRAVRGKPLPGWASDIDCTSWAQVFLKFILAHPAVTCPIPATSKPEHAADNLRAGAGRLPDGGLRQKIISALG